MIKLFLSGTPQKPITFRQSKIFSQRCLWKIDKIFHDKARLFQLCVEELMLQFEWEAHHWRTLERIVPEPETEEEAIKRMREGKPRKVDIILPSPPTHRFGCISRRFINEQVRKMGAIIGAAKTIEEFLDRVEREVEVL